MKKISTAVLLAVILIIGVTCIYKYVSNNNLFSKNEYCRENYSELVTKKLKDKSSYLDTGSFKNSLSFDMTDLFYSPSDQKCYFAYKVQSSTVTNGSLTEESRMGIQDVVSDLPLNTFSINETVEFNKAIGRLKGI